MGERGTGIPSCWSGFCNLWASFLGMGSELCRFLKGKPSTDVGGLGWDLCGLNQEFESEPEKHPLGCSDLGWDSCSPTELTGPLSLGEEAWGLCVCLEGGSGCSVLWHAGLSPMCPLASKCREDVEKGTPACSWQHVARLLACYYLGLCFVVY